MSDFHQQAIEDVARATNRELFEVETDEEVGSSAGANELESMTTCAVAQRERVLELEAERALGKQSVLIEIGSVCSNRAHTDKHYHARRAYLEIGEKCLQLNAALAAPEKAKP